MVVTSFHDRNDALQFFGELGRTGSDAVDAPEFSN